MQDLTSAPVPLLRPDDHVRGTGDLIVMYGDLSCPRCAVTALALRDEGRRVAFRHFALKARHPRAVALARASEAAAVLGAFWPFHDLVMADQGHLDDPHLWAHAESLGLDLADFERERRSDSAADRVRRDTQEGLRAGLTATPALVTPGHAPDAAERLSVRPG
jgi:protein-disulfide isomerase